jgi:hypothetical protein
MNADDAKELAAFQATLQRVAKVSPTPHRTFLSVAVRCSLQAQHAPVCVRVFLRVC